MGIEFGKGIRDIDEQMEALVPKIKEWTNMQLVSYIKDLHALVIQVPYGKAAQRVMFTIYNIKKIEAYPDIITLYTDDTRIGIIKGGNVEVLINEKWAVKRL